MTSVPLVQNFSLPGEICRKFALDWSADNKISVCTNKAVYILNSYCSPVESGFPSPLHKQVICAPKEGLVLEHRNFPSNPYNLASSVEEKVNLYRILIDHTLNPTPSERAESFRGYRCAKWSPKGAARAGRCLLATLTMDHRLTLFEEKEKEWVCLRDLSEELASEKKKQSEAEPKSKSPRKKRKRDTKARETKPRTRSKQKSIINLSSDDDEDDDSSVDIPSSLNYEKLVESTYKFASVEITWTGMFGSPASSMNESYEYCYLIVAMKSGHIIFWKVSPNDGKIVSKAHECDVGLGLLTTICWQQTSPTAGFLICGSYKGILAFLPITVRTELDQEPKVVVKDLNIVWDDEDSVPVDHIAVLKIALKKYVIIAAKQRALVGCEIALMESNAIIRTVGHSFGLHRLPVTGMSVLDTSMPQYHVLIATMEGLLVEIKISLGKDEIKFQHEKINIDLDLKNMMIQGLAVSSNGLLCALVLNTATYYDHLEKKEPLQFAMFVTRPFEDIYLKLKSVLKPQFSFLPATSGSINKHTDFLECIRINLACGTTLPDWVTAFLDNDPITYENFSAMELYFMRFLLHAYVSGLAASAPKDKGNLELKLYTVEAIIMRNYISKVFGSCQDKIDLLTPAQGQSLLLMADWLFKEFQMPVESLYSALGCDMPIDAESLPARETCRICKSEVKLDNIKIGQCTKNHMFARCCQSLLLCDVIPYYQCTSCKSVALQDVWSFGLACTYCGMPMT